jgi:uncharacterized protein
MTTQITSTSAVATEKPVPYMRQLCKHFGHKLAADFGDDTGYIVFADARCDLLADTEAATLHLTISGDSAEGVERISGVVGSHLERFGKRDELLVRWDA